jgi:hypothetical protein
MESPPKVLQLLLQQPIPISRCTTGVVTRSITLDLQNLTTGFVGCSATMSIRNWEAALCEINLKPADVRQSKTSSCTARRW